MSSQEHKTEKADSRESKINSLKILIEYCKIPANNVKIKGDLRKIIEAYDKGELDNYIK